MRRRYNQAALLAQAISRFREAEVLVDGLVRAQRTVPLDGHSRDERFAVLDGAISAHPKRQASINGRSILLVDDVMTSGATLTAATEAVCAAGATDVFVVTLARVLKGH
ncbi:ComF family protein [Yoonia litorea]|nr:phosphoribosyltransferase family protein [Yoonia litorea]